MEELRTLPQLISSYSAEGLRRCRELFAPLTTDVVELSPIEAELAKLFNNTWRYTLFATANQFYMLANDHGADFYRIHDAMTHNYPRAQGLPKPGFAQAPVSSKTPCSSRPSTITAFIWAMPRCWLMRACLTILSIA